MHKDKDEITVYYDGGCPRCIKDMRTYERLSRGLHGTIDWVDITSQKEKLSESGIDPIKALMELHVKDQNQNILSEIDAYILLMSKVPRLKPLARVIDLPIIRPALSKVYQWHVRRRLQRSGRIQ